MNIPIITGGKALELAALSCSSNGYASMYSSAMSPFSKTTVDINKLYVSGSYSNKISDEGEGSTEKAEEALLSKTGECLLGGRSKRWSGGAQKGRFQLLLSDRPGTGQQLRGWSSLFSHTSGLVERCQVGG